jgi:hypothetical protein
MTSPKPRHVGHSRARDDLAEERPLHALHLAAAVADVARAWRAAGRAARPEHSEHSTAVSTGSSR